MREIIMAEAFLLEERACDLSYKDWCELIAEAPADVKKQIVMLKSAGTQATCVILIIKA